MRSIEVSTDVFAQIWALREHEDTEDEILRRVLISGSASFSSGNEKVPSQTGGLHDQRFGVSFPDGFEVERTYLGTRFHAIVDKGQWIISGFGGRYSSLNELSRAIGTKTENAWANWFYIDRKGVRRPVSDLRDPQRIVSRSRSKAAKRGDLKDTTLEKARWCDDVKTALTQLEGRASLAKIYEMVREIRRAAGRSTPRSLEEVVRKELEMRSSDSEVYDAERGEDWFQMAEGKGSGVWALRGE